MTGVFIGPRTDVHQGAWTDLHNRRLRSMWGDATHTMKDIQRALGRTYFSVTAQARRLGLAPRCAPPPGALPVAEPEVAARPLGYHQQVLAAKFDPRNKLPALAPGEADRLIAEYRARGGKVHTP